MSRAIRVLMVEDSVEDAFFIVRELRRGGFEVEFERVHTGPTMQAALEAGHWDLIICDYRMPHFNGAAALALCQKSGLDAPFIMVSGAISEELAVETLKAGADDYIMKDNLSRLAESVGRALYDADARQIRRETESTATFLVSVTESQDDAVIGERLDGTVVSWMGGAEKLYGYAATETIGRSISVVVPVDRAEELAIMLERVASGLHLEQWETVRLRKDGARVEVSLTVSPVIDSNGRTVGASVVARDMNRHKKEETGRLERAQDSTSGVAQEKASADKGHG
jgi:two-component system, cell cycle sensor histidine kinase and response regulator CckA